MGCRQIAALYMKRNSGQLLTVVRLTDGTTLMHIRSSRRNPFVLAASGTWRQATKGFVRIVDAVRMFHLGEK